MEQEHVEAKIHLRGDTFDDDARGLVHEGMEMMKKAEDDFQKNGGEDGSQNSAADESGALASSLTGGPTHLDTISEGTSNFIVSSVLTAMQSFIC